MPDAKNHRASANMTAEAAAERAVIHEVTFPAHFFLSLCQDRVTDSRWFDETWGKWCYKEGSLSRNRATREI